MALHLVTIRTAMLSTTLTPHIPRIQAMHHLLMTQITHTIQTGLHRLLELDLGMIVDRRSRRVPVHSWTSWLTEPQRPATQDICEETRATCRLHHLKRKTITEEDCRTASVTLHQNEGPFRIEVETLTSVVRRPLHLVPPWKGQPHQELVQQPQT